MYSVYLLHRSNGTFHFIAIEDRLAILDRLKKGETQAKNAKIIKRNGNKICNFASALDNLAMSKKRKVLRITLL